MRGGGLKNKGCIYAILDLDSSIAIFIEYPIGDESVRNTREANIFEVDYLELCPYHIPPSKFFDIPIKLAF